MRVFKAKPFVRFAAKEGIADVVLHDAIRRAEAGLIDADLGGGVIKQRLARQGQGKSGGFRSIVLSGAGSRHSSFMASLRTTETTSIDRN